MSETFDEGVKEITNCEIIKNVKGNLKRKIAEFFTSAKHQIFFRFYKMVRLQKKIEKILNKTIHQKYETFTIKGLFMPHV